MFLCVLTIILAKVSSTYVTISVLMDDSRQLWHSQVTLSMRKLCHQLYHTLPDSGDGARIRDGSWMWLPTLWQVGKTDILLTISLHDSLMVYQVPGVPMWSGRWPGYPGHPQAGQAHQEGAPGGKEVDKRPEKYLNFNLLRSSLSR